MYRSLARSSSKLQLWMAVYGALWSHSAWTRAQGEAGPLVGRQLEDWSEEKCHPQQRELDWHCMSGRPRAADTQLGLPELSARGFSCCSAAEHASHGSFHQGLQK